MRIDPREFREGKISFEMLSEPVTYVSVDFRVTHDDVLPLPAST